MTAHRTIFSLVYWGLSATVAMGAPYCTTMLHGDQLERRYQRIAPIYNTSETGWMFGADQLDVNYAMSDHEVTLMAQIVDEFAARGARLAVLIAPPRPIVAGQEVLDATTGTPGAFDMAAHTADFNQLVAQLDAAGAIAPNLLDMVLADREISATYYFHRDTHWTNTGAAHSALALATALDPAPAPAFQVADLAIAETHEERGSLSDIARAVCDTSPPPEFSPVYDYTPFITSDAGLLDDGAASDPAVILLGTSFSNRYRRDQYQVTDALAAALGRDVMNYSVSGGGLLGPMETYILTGQLDADQPDLVIWEFPYTYEPNETNLRQMLGALRANRGAVVSQHTLPLVGEQAEFLIEAAEHVAPIIGITPDIPGGRNITVSVDFEDGTTERLRLRRKSRMEEVAILNDWWIDLSGYAHGQPTRLHLEMPSDTEARAVTLEFRAP